MLNTFHSLAQQQFELFSRSVTGSDLLFAFSLHCLIGGIATIIAGLKGYRLGAWLLLGLIGGTFALVAAIALQEKPRLPDPGN
jgi:hypothetical protein